jgi:Tetratricopeptide repeat
LREEELMAADDAPQPAFMQKVTAVSGFAYGVIGADIHVFDSGIPLYLLANWQPEPVADAGWLRELPSRMLNARRAVVPFTGRDTELADLRGWRDGDTRLAVRWMHGPGGQGKTRLSDQLAAESAAVGWKVVTASNGAEADRIEPGGQDLRLNGASGLLVIVDYADRWPLTNITWLFKNAMLHHPGMIARVLLIARTTDGWPAVRAILDAHQAGVSAQFLDALPPETGARADMYSAALSSFAAVYDLPGDPSADSTVRLDDPDSGLTLAVHMAALVAVDAFVTGRRPARDMASLTIYLLDREHLHWARLYNDGISAAGEHHYRTSPEVINQVVYTAALTGAVPRATGQLTLERLRISEPAQALDDHSIIYPAGDLRDGNVLEPLYPDRLAEDFLALSLPGHQAEYPAQAWAGATAADLLARNGDGTKPAAWTPRALTFLASAASRWPHLGPGYLYPLLLKDPQLAIDAGNAAMTALANLPGIDPAVLDAIETCFPGHRHVDLDPGIAAVARRAAEFHLTAANPASRARIHGELGLLLANAGLDEQALASTRQATDLLRVLAKGDPVTFTLDFTAALTNLGRDLFRLGRSEEAVGATREAVATYRRLAQVTPADFNPLLARALSNLGAQLSRTGRREEALRAGREAAEVWSRLAPGDKTGHEASIASSLLNLGARLSEAGQPAGALPPTQEATAEYRKLTHANPAAYAPLLAKALDNLGSLLSDTGRREEAMAPTEEAVTEYRRLARANPDAFTGELARSLSNLGNRLSLLGRFDEAMPPALEAVDVFRKLARETPAAHEPSLALALSNLGIWLARMGRFTEALAAEQESVEIRRRLAQANPAACTPDLASSLDKLGLRLKEVGRASEALDAARESAATWQRLAEANRDAFAPGFASSLTNLGVRQARGDLPEEALATTERAVAEYRRLAERNPDAFIPLLAKALDNLGMRLLDVGQLAEAFGPTEESVAIRRRLARDEPLAFTADLARSLGNLGLELANAGRRDEALAASEETLALFQQLARSGRSSFEAELASAHFNKALRLSELGRLEESVTSAREAIPIYRQLAASNPAEFGRWLVASLQCLGASLKELERWLEALAVISEIKKVRRQLAIH